MLGWLRRRRERTAWIEAEAEALSRELGVEAYSEARRREREANSIAEARQYNRVALAIAGRACNAVGAGARMASDALLASTFETPARRQGAPLPDEGQIGEIRSAASDGTLAQFRLQFLAVADDRTLKVVKEHEVHASDVPGAIRRAVQIEWPPRAIGFKLIDRDGQQVFGRQSGDRGS